MDEVLSILIAVTAMFAALWLLGWAYGDFRRKPDASKPAQGSGDSSSS